MSKKCTYFSLHYADFVGGDTTLPPPDPHWTSEVAGFATKPPTVKSGFAFNKLEIL